MRISDWSSDVCSSDLPPYSSRQKVPESFLRRSLLRRKSSSSLPPSTSQVSWRTRALLRKYWCPVGSQVQALGPFIRSVEHTSELQSLMRNSYAVFCLHKKSQSTTSESCNNMLIIKP